MVAGLGVGPTAASPTPESGRNDWLQISAGSGHTCGIRVGGILVCWGDDYHGQLGNGTDGLQQVPDRIGSFARWTAVSAGSVHTCALRSTGQLYCWGYNANGELGTGSTGGVEINPVQVFGGATNWTSVSTGNAHTCARRSTGRLFCWGDDAQGQLGNGALGDQDAPVQVVGNRTDWTSVSAGFSHSCARRSTGRLFCWGDDSTGQLGNGAPFSTEGAPVQVAGTRTDWTSVSAGITHTCARRSTGRLFCWGDDAQGQLGNDDPLSNEGAPVQVYGNYTNWTAVSAGGYHTCARNSNGLLFCWGDDGFGQLGDGGTNTDLHAPDGVLAGGANDWRAFDAGIFHTCALIEAKRAFCWGYDGSGRLGNGDAGDQSRPDEVWS